MSFGIPEYAIVDFLGLVVPFVDHSAKFRTVFDSMASDKRGDPCGRVCTDVVFEGVEVAKAEFAVVGEGFALDALTCELSPHVSCAIPPPRAVSTTHGHSPFGSRRCSRYLGRCQGIRLESV